MGYIGDEMLLERIESEGLAHYSYLIGDGHEAAVIDPRRDVDVYLERATRSGMRISHILETHRHEDFVVGSRELAQESGATILRPAQEDVLYGQPIHDRERLRIGRLALEALHTPGHTPGHTAYLLHDPGGAPWLLFSGDALFAGEVGRVDLFGRERIEEAATQLYDSVFHTILPLGDSIILCPAHGAGSACGANIAERPWTTIGLERRLNPRLEHTQRSSFVGQVGQALEFPPYFRTMEQMNRDGPPLLGRLPTPPALAPDEFAGRAQAAQRLDARDVTAFGASHVPGALSIWPGGVPSFAGWFLSYEQPLLLLSEAGDPSRLVRHLIRLGYDRLAGYLAGGMIAWHKAGLDGQQVRTVSVQALCQRLDRGEDTWLLDVRSQGELEGEGRIPNAHHIHVTLLPDRLHEVPRNRPVHIFCGSGLRSMIAASLLQRAGWPDLTVVLGGFAGWTSVRCPVERAHQPDPALVAGPTDLR